MSPMKIAARQLASDIAVPPSRISDTVNGARPITTDTALRLGLFVCMDARFWLNLQTEYDAHGEAHLAGQDQATGAGVSGRAGGF